MMSNYTIKTVQDILYIFDEDPYNFSINLSGHNFDSLEGSDDSTWFYRYTYYTCTKCDLSIKRIDKDKILLFGESYNISKRDKIKELIFDDEISKIISCEEFCNRKIIKNIIE